MQNDPEIVKDGALFCGDGYALRLSSDDTGTANSSNTICGFRKIVKYDDVPCVSCNVRPKEAEFSLMNTTFIKKVSHSSQKLTVNKMRGSINHTDIMKEVEEIKNDPCNFVKLLKIHRSVYQKDNIERIVNSTLDIKPSKEKFTPTEKERKRLFASPFLSKAIAGSDEYRDINNKLHQKVQSEHDRIIECAKQNNAKNRGDGIEEIITGKKPDHGLCDVIESIYDETSVGIGIKTKIVSDGSNPTLYSIDKVLQWLADGSIFALFIIEVDSNNKVIRKILLSIFDRTIIEASTIQQHWSGRNARGHTQLEFSKCYNIFDDDYSESIDINFSKKYIKKLLES